MRHPKKKYCNTNPRAPCCNTARRSASESVASKLPRRFRSNAAAARRPSVREYPCSTLRVPLKYPLRRDRPGFSPPLRAREVRGEVQQERRAQRGHPLHAPLARYGIPAYSHTRSRRGRDAATAGPTPALPCVSAASVPRVYASTLGSVLRVPRERLRASGFRGLGSHGSAHRTSGPLKAPETPLKPRHVTPRPAQPRTHTAIGSSAAQAFGGG